jgi:hypothetical protein
MFECRASGRGMAAQVGCACCLAVRRDDAVRQLSVGSGLPQRHSIVLWYLSVFQGLVRGRALGWRMVT